MKLTRKIIFYTFLVSTISITAFAFWFFSANLSKEQIAKAFPLNSYETFSNGKNLTLYSISPDKTLEGAETLQGYSVIGKTEIKNQNFQQLLKRAFLNDIKSNIITEEEFRPSYAIRISNLEEHIDIAICFEYEKFFVIKDGKKAMGRIKGNSKALFNKTLTDAGVNLHPK